MSADTPAFLQRLIGKTAAEKAHLQEHLDPLKAESNTSQPTALIAAAPADTAPFLHQLIGKTVAEKEQLKVQLDAKTAEVTTLQAANADLTRQLEARTTDLNAARAASAQLEIRLSNTEEEHRNVLEGLEGLLADVKTERDRLREENRRLGKSKGREEETVTKSNDAKEARAAAVHLTSTVTRLKKELSRKEAELDETIKDNITIQMGLKQTIYEYRREIMN
ncbi:hypothetical protein HDV00_002665 [Rhizophlyctis rosea]|nr:hypothetical protein HDV00_002665 [Rhizophlyctis rosea]